MPLVVEKEVIRPGTYWYVDEYTGLPAKATFTPESIKKLHDDGKAMLSAGLSVPVPMEHQRDAKPMTAAERAAARLKNNAGYVKDYRLKKVKNEDGSEVEALFSDLDIDDTDLKLSSIKWTSPWITSFTDGAGKSWNNVVGHVALTTRPRIVNQLPFPSLSAAMSLAANLADKKIDVTPNVPGGVLLSRAGLLREKSGIFSPAYPMAFSLFSGVRLAAEDLPPKKKPDEKPPAKGGDKPGSDGDGKPAPKGDATVPADPNDPQLQPQEEALVDADGDIPICEVIQDLLEAVGINLEPGDEANFEERLYKAVMEQIKTKAGGSDMTTPNPNAPAPPPAKPPVIQEQPPLYMSMSLDDANKITDPDKKAMALSIIGLRDKQSRLEANAFETAKKYRQARIDRLAKKVSPKVKDMLLSKLAGATFSMGDDGRVQDSLDDTLTMLEHSIPDLPELLLSNHVNPTVQPHPKEFQGELTEERTNQVVEEMCKAGGVPEPRKAS